MKKLIAAILSIVLLTALPSCASKKGHTKSLYDHGMELVGIMAEMATNEDYIKAYSMPDDILASLGSISPEHYQEPTAVYEIRVNQKYIYQYMDLDGWSYMGFSEGMQKVFSNRALHSFATQINAQAGSSHVAAASICTASKSFVSSGLAEGVLYLYTYGMLPPVLVSFTPGEDGAVEANSVFILTSQFRPQSREDVLEALNKEFVTVKVIKE